MTFTHSELVEAAEIHPLLAAVALASGDDRYLDPAYAPQLGRRGATLVRNGGLDPETLAAAQALAADGLEDLFAGGGPAETLPLEQVIGFLAAGQDTSSEDMFLQETGLLSAEREAPHHDLDEQHAVIIGAGVSGIAAAIRLLERGARVTLLEKNPDVGGTWWENRYPGCRLDTPNFAYSYSFAPRTRLPDHYSRREVILDYLRDVAESYGVRQLVRFGTTATGATWNESTANWTVSFTDALGRDLDVDADILITAVGQLNRPLIPDFPGLDTFRGEVVHSATWPEGLDCTSKHVAVIGTGASGFQIVPAIAADVSSMKVVMRNPPWLLPTPNYHEPITGPLEALLDRAPLYGRMLRFWQFLLSVEAWYPLVQADPGWDVPGTLSQANQDFRDELVAHLRSQLGHEPHLMEALTPTYPPGSKRMLRDNGVWAQSLQLPHVELLTSPVTRFDETGFHTQDGRHHRVDTLILATGFRASEFLEPLRITGRGGVDLHETWGGEPRAFGTAMVPSFPNFFMLLGPNSGLAANGSIIFMTEGVVDFLDRVLSLRQGSRAIEVRPEAYVQFGDWVDAGNRRMAWGQPGVSTWYQNSSGRVTANWPYPLSEFWRVTHEVSADDFTLIP